MQKKQLTAPYDNNVYSWIFFERDLVSIYDQDQAKLGKRNFEPMWHGSLIVKNLIKLGSYKLANDDGELLSETHNGLYRKK